MPINLTGLTATVQKAVGVQASAKALIEGIGAAISKAVMDALAADESADAATEAAVQAAIDGVVADLSSSSDALGAAVVANTPTPPPA